MIRPGSFCARRTGMTLVEVMLAVAILSVGLSALLVAASRCIAVIRSARQYQEAQWVMGLGDLEHPIEITEETEDVMDFEVSDVEYTDGFVYSREIEDDEDEDGLYVVRTRVTWAGRARDLKEEVVGYIYFPEEEE